MVLHSLRILSICALAWFVSPTCAKVSLKVNGSLVQVSNDQVQFNFKSNADVGSLLVGGMDIIADYSFYLDWTGDYGETRFQGSKITIVEETDTRAHFYWTQDSSVAPDAFHIELHYILEDGLSGIYIYAKYTNDKSINVSYGENRMIYRFNPTILTQGTNQVRSGAIPTAADVANSTTVQDSTWLFPNGTYYTKYDYAVYIRETQYQGVYGNGYGAFVISPSKDYHGGGPMKQDLTVHTYSLVSNYFMSSHLTGAVGLNAPPGWMHLYGPFLMYLPIGENGKILSDVAKQVDIEKGKWPYTFVNDDEYPLVRGSVKGTVNGQSNATVTVYDSVDEPFDLQQLGYLYTTNTKFDGSYEIDNIRPGSYKMVVYPLAGQGSENLIEDTVTVTAGGVAQVNFTLPEPENILWSLGEANRRANEFAYADEPRNYQWHLKPPITNTFTIGESDPKTNWYYAQSQPGSWYIKYQDTQDGNSRTLRLPLAAANVTHLLVKLNTYTIGDLHLENDGAVYRSAMQSGRYHSNVFTVKPEQVVTGENVLELTIISGGVMYDAISLQINK